MRVQFTTILKFIISAALIAWVFSRVKLAEVGAQLASANPWLFAAALILYLAAIAVNAAKWRILLVAQGVRIPFAALLEFQFVGFFFNNFLPNVGGDVMRGYTLARYTDRTAAAAVSVIVDRIVGFIAYMSTAVIAALVAVNVAGHRDLRAVEGVALVALGGLAAGFGVLLSRRLRSLIGRVFAWRPLAPLAPRWEHVSEAFNAYRFRYGALAQAFGVALLGILCTTFVNWSLSQAMGGLMPLPVIFLFNPLIALVLMIPISIGGIGVSQTAYPFFFGLGGVPAGHALAVSLLMQLVIILGSLPGGFFWLRGRRPTARPAGG
ncbi:MAG: flippase-like domain-containing protein [Chloroflexi bacterium]|nr:flippase-like domain-containing protein [Chloroflexota bacterium]